MPRISMRADPIRGPRNAFLRHPQWLAPVPADGWLRSLCSGAPSRLPQSRLTWTDEPRSQHNPLPRFEPAPSTVFRSGGASASGARGTSPRLSVGGLRCPDELTHLYGAG